MKASSRQITNVVDAKYQGYLLYSTNSVEEETLLQLSPIFFEKTAQEEEEDDANYF